MLYTLVPLGNPGEKYARTRHNVGRFVMEEIKNDVETLPGCELFVPECFMNESGQAVAHYLRYHEGRELIIIYDDKDLAFGRFRISYDRGDGGHNGLKSIIQSLGTRDFIRIRIGIAPHDTDGKEILPPHGESVSDYVLGKMRDDEEISLREVAPRVLDAIRTIIDAGYEKAMERYN